MSPMPIASVTFAPQPSSSIARNAGSPPPGSPATSTRSTRRSAQVGPLEQVRGVRRRQHDRLRAQPRDRLEEPVRVARPDRDVREPDPPDRVERRAGDERAGVVGRDDPLARLDARGGVAARRARDPVLEIAGGERDVARRAGRAARRVDADDLVTADAEVRADRVLVRRGRLQLGLLGKRQPGDVGEPNGAVQLLAVERRAFEDVRDLLAERGVVERELLVPGPGLDLRVEDHAGGSYSTAASAAAASRSPTGSARSSARCASRLAVRARIGIALTASAG